MQKKIDIPRGFLFSSVEAAIKKPGRKDLAIICSENQSVIAGVFTTNRVKAAPVRIDMQRIRSGRGQAIIMNSGNANACTGRQGTQDAKEIVRAVARASGIDEKLIYICSTGVIGTPLPMGRIIPKISPLVQGLGKSTVHDAASAIMTTDTFPKIASRKVKIGGVTGTITGICKGAGMICPQMATMLCFIMTDFNLRMTALDSALRNAVRSTFNRITVDGDRSTNDTVLLLANGMAGNAPIRKNSEDLKAFETALSEISASLSKMIVQDGEGATKIVTVEIKNARSEQDAEQAAFAIANSLLVKTAIYGNDANWGRIMAALGRTTVSMKEERVDIFFGKVLVVNKGVATGKDSQASSVLRRKQVTLTVDLHMGKASAEVLTCDLTEGYIRENASYRT